MKRSAWIEIIERYSDGGAGSGMEKHTIKGATAGRTLEGSLTGRGDCFLAVYTKQPASEQNVELPTVYCAHTVDVSSEEYLICKSAKRWGEWRTEDEACIPWDEISAMAYVRLDRA